MSADALRSSGDFEEFATIAAASAGLTANPTPTRRVVCLADGVLVVKQAEGGTSRTITVKGGVPEEIQIIGITAAGSSGAAPIKVYR